MLLHVLMGQRKESYPGEYGPEALAVIDEFGQSDNPDYMAGELAKYRATDEFEGIAVIDLEVSQSAILAILRPQPKPIAAAIVRSDA